MNIKKRPPLDEVLTLTEGYELRAGIRLLFEGKMSDADRVEATTKLVALAGSREPRLVRAVIRHLSNVCDRAYLWWRLYVATRAASDLDQVEGNLKTYLPQRDLGSKVPNREALITAVATCRSKQMEPRNIASIRYGLNEIKHEDLREEVAVLVGLGSAPKTNTLSPDEATRAQLLAGRRQNITDLLAGSVSAAWPILNEVSEMALLGATEEATALLSPGSRVATKISLDEFPKFVDHVYASAVQGALSQRRFMDARAYAEKICAPGARAVSLVTIGIAVSAIKKSN